jgi:hypothetical protein
MVDNFGTLNITNTMVQYAGERIVANVFFSFFWGAVVVRGQDNDVPPRGGARVRRPIFTLVGEIIIFLFRPSM